MISDLENLIKLQDVDDRIYKLELSKKEYPQEVEQLEEDIAIADKTVTTIQSKLESIVSEQKTIEETVNDAKIHLESSQERLNTISTNREYDAVHNEIAAQKKIIEKNERQKTKLVEDKAELENSLKEASEQLTTIKTAHEPKIKDLKSKIASIDSDIAKVVKERKEILPKILPQFLRPYEHIVKHRKTKKAVSLINDTGNCSICFKVLEAQLINEIRKANRLHICESCGSLLVWDNTPKTEVVEEE